MHLSARLRWWKKTCEAVFFSFLNMMLISLGGEELERRLSAVLGGGCSVADNPF